MLVEEALDIYKTCFFKVVLKVFHKLYQLTIDDVCYIYETCSSEKNKGEMPFYFLGVVSGKVQSPSKGKQNYLDFPLIECIHCSKMRETEYIFSILLTNEHRTKKNK